MARDWRRLFWRTTVSVRTTWTFRLMLVAGLSLLLIMARGVWIPMVGRALVCDSSIRPSDAIMVDNFEVNYLIFERAEQLKSSGIASRVLVPTQASIESGEPNRVFAGIAEVMAGVARLPHPELIPVREIEPISLNAAYQIRDFLQRERLRSIVLVTPAFRSRRSALIYAAVLGPVGIRTSCVPVFGPQQGPDTWSRTLHGIQEVVEQHMKLLYYKLYVMPYLLHRSS